MRAAEPRVTAEPGVAAESAVAAELRFAAAPGVDAGSPYPGLQAFGEADRAFFHGRAREIEELFRLVRREVLTVLFGRSGLGKTSLLNAGLFPLLRQADVLPIPIRLDFTPGKGDLVDQVRAACAAALEAQQVDAPPPAAGETLWEHFHQAQLWSRRNRLLTPLLVFDQFEEIFTLGRRDERVEPLITELADLIENHIPDSVRDRIARTHEELAFSYERQKVRVVFSLREDFLPQLEGLLPRIPSLARNRFRLLQMDGHQALDAILKPGGDLVGEEVAVEILRFVAGASREERAGEPGAAPAAPEDDLVDMEVEPALLSLFCRELNDRRLARGLPAITAELVRGTHGEILSAFYDQCLADMGRPVRTFIEERLLTGSGFRQSLPLADALQGQGLTSEDLAKLVDRRLLRLEDRFGRPHVELIHDVMTRVIRDSRDRRRAQEAHRRRLVWASLAAWVLLAMVVALVAFSLWQRGLKEGADEQRAEAQLQRGRAAVYRVKAEQVMRYMLFDLYQQLAPRGEYAIVRELTTKVLDYLSSVERSDSSERLRSAALTTLGGLDRWDRKTVDAEKHYGEALAIARTLHKKDPTDRLGRRELALSLMGLSGLLANRGDYDGARGLFSEAIPLLRDLALHPSGQDKSQEAYASKVSEFASLFRNHQRLSAVLAAYGTILRDIEALVARNPASRELEAELAAAYRGQAQTLRYRGDAQSARTYLQKALDIQNRLAQESPDSSAFTLELARSRAHAAETEFAAGNLPGALAMAGSSASLAAPYASQESAGAFWRDLVASADLVKGDVYLRRADTTAALAQYQAALTTFTKDAKRSPDWVDFQSAVSWARYRIGSAYALRGDGALARREWTRAVEVISPFVKTDSSEVLDGYVRPLLELGRLDEARPVCHKLQERDWDYLDLQRACRNKGLL